jgi:hypothetical protein
MSAPVLQILSRPLPPLSLLAQCISPGDYADCLTVDVPGAISLGKYVQAFYSSAAFRPERMVLRLIGRGSNDADVRALADGSADDFAAWDVEARGADELLLCDFQHRTRSWLKVEPLAEPVSGALPGSPATRLTFGSGVMHPRGAGSGGGKLFRLLLPIHKIYAKLLLKSAAKQLMRAGRAG